MRQSARSAVQSGREAPARNFGFKTRIVPSDLEEIALHILGRPGIMAEVPPVRDWRRVEALDRDVVLAATKGEIFCLESATGRILWNNELKGLGRGSDDGGDG